MTPKRPEVELLLGFGGTFRRVPLASLAAVTHVPIPALRESLSRLVLSFLDQSDEHLDSSPGREPTEGGSEELGTVPTEPGPNGTVPEREKTVTVPNRTVLRDPSDVPEREEPLSGSTPETTLTAEVLALTLDDHASLPFYRTLLATTDHATVETALAETCARRREIRGALGAYFVAIIRRLTHAPHYARTPPNAP